METGNLNQNRIFGKTVALLSHALGYQGANHSVISGNLANIDTPGYRPQALTFDQELRRAVEKETIPLSKTNDKHFPRSVDLFRGNASHKLETKEPPSDGTTRIDIDQEMAKMVQNNLVYEASARLLAKKFEGLRAAIEGRR